MSGLCGVGNEAKNISKIYVGVGDKSKEVQKAYVGVGDKAKLWFESGISMNSLSVGTDIYINVSETQTAFRIVHKGNPSSKIYDGSCSGIWLMSMVSAGSMRHKPWAVYPSGTYDISDIYTWLNDTYPTYFTKSVQGKIRQVKIPYWGKEGAGSKGSLYTGSSGLSVKAFLPSTYEVGFTTDDDTEMKIEGAKLSYFTSASRRIMSDGKYNNWWTRSPRIDYQASSNGFFAVDNATGKLIAYKNDWDYLHVYPIIILPTDTTVTQKSNKYYLS